MNEYFKKTIVLATKAFNNDEVPVGAVVVKNGKMIGMGYNKKNKSKIVTDHAEIIAINMAAKKIGDWRLNDCELYVSLEPCNMCKEVIKHARIKKVYYLVKSNFYNENGREIKYIESEYIDDIAMIKYKNLLKCFFSSKR